MLFIFMKIQTPMSRLNLFFKITIFILLLFVLVLSFYLYSPINYKFLNSDQGIHALMAADFDFNNCFYYWGQNRLGSILPMLASFLVALNFPPLLAVSLIQYAFLLSTYIILFKLINNYVLKLAAMILLFLPVVTYVEILNIGHPYAPQIFFSVLLLYLSRIISSSYSFKNILVILLFWFIGLLSVWVSEVSFIVVIIIICFTLICLSKSKKKFNDKIVHLILSPFFISIPIGFFGFFMFINI